MLSLTACSSGTSHEGSLSDSGAGDGATGNGGVAGNGGATGNGGASTNAGGSGTGTGGTRTGAGGASFISGCTPLLTLVDTATSPHVVGSGTAASCTESALKAAVAAGGVVTFDCGDAPVTITVTSQIDLPTTADTTLDGNGKITLDGGGSTRILSFSDANFRTSRTTLTLQRLTFQHGKSSGTQIPTAPAPCSQGTDVDGGGSAVFVRNGVVHVIDSTFRDNQAPSIGPDVGGALYALGSLEVIVQGSEFDGNDGANGGALYLLNSDLKVVSSNFVGNAALGTGENTIDSKCAVRGGESGNGGNAAAVAIDGGSDGDDLFCGVTFSNNKGNELGTIGRTPDGSTRTTTFDRCTFDGNQAKGGGALYFHNSKLVITASTFSNNTATGAGAIQSDGSTLDFTNVTFSGNSATSGLGGAISLFGNGGTLTNCTFADNKAEGGSGLFGAAIAGGTTLTISNTLFSNDTSKDCGAPMACQDGSSTGNGDFQWPAAHTVCANADTKCTSSTTFADPKVAALADNGGPTKTCLPASDSPAKGAGTNCPATDQRGVTRPSTGCAAGAVEF